MPHNNLGRLKNKKHQDAYNGDGIYLCTDNAAEYNVFGIIILAPAQKKPGKNCIHRYKKELQQVKILLQ
jgi:hypothetical protein